jgi:SAM-dependent methyltransferase
MQASLARYYEDHYADARVSRRVIAPAGPPRNRYEACVAHFPRCFRGGSILELGAGTGLVARSLIAQGVAFSEYIASDRTEAALGPLAAGLDDPRVDTLRIDAEQVSEDLEGRFDAILMVALIEHLVDPLLAMQRIRKLLRPGGFVYLDTPNIAKYTRRLKLLFGHFPATASRREGLVCYDGAPASLHDEGHLHYFTYRSLTRMLTERCGFSRVEKLPYFQSAPAPLAGVAHSAARVWPELLSEVAIAAYA